MLLFRSVRTVVVFGALFALAGCGFRPLYNQPTATNAAGGYNVQADLATVSIDPIKDRIGQQLRNQLLTRLNPGGNPAKPVYSLRVSVSEGVQELGIRKSSYASRANLRILASYSLSFVSSEQSIANSARTEKDQIKLPSGSVLAISSYDISAFEFTTLTARKDARSRAIREIADDLKTRLAVHFAQARKK